MKRKVLAENYSSKLESIEHFHIAVRAELYGSICLGKYFDTTGHRIELSWSLDLHHLIPSEGKQRIPFTFQIYRTECWEDPRRCS